MRSKKLKSWKDILKIGIAISETEYFIPEGYHGLSHPIVTDEMEEYFQREEEYNEEVRLHKAMIILVGW